MYQPKFLILQFSVYLLFLLYKTLSFFLNAQFIDMMGRVPHAATEARAILNSALTLKQLNIASVII